MDIEAGVGVNGVSRERIVELGRKAAAEGKLRNASSKPGPISDSVPSMRERLSKELFDAAAQIKKHLHHGMVALLRNDEVWRARRALRAGGKFRRGALDCHVETVVEGAGSSHPCACASDLEEAISGLSLAITSAREALRENGTPEAFQFGLGPAFSEQITLAEEIVWGLELAHFYPPRAEIEDLFACAHKLLTILRASRVMSAPEEDDE